MNYILLVWLLLIYRWRKIAPIAHFVAVESAGSLKVVGQSFPDSELTQIQSGFFWRGTKMNRKHARKLLVAGLAAIGLAWSATGSALTISDVTNPNGPNLWSDNNAEVLIDLFNSAGGACPGAGCTVGGFPTVDPGDIIVSALGFGQYNATNGAGVTNEATALLILQVLTSAATAPSNCGGAPSCATYSFGAVPSFNAVAGLFGAGLGLTLGPYAEAVPGTIGLVFFDNSKNFFNTAAPDFSASINQTYAFATDGTVEAALGLVSFTGTAPQNLVDLTSGNASIKPGGGAGGFAFTLSVLNQTFPGFTIVGDITGTSNVSEPNIGPFVNRGIRTDTTIAFDTIRIPEPATLALLGLGLAGLGLSRRRKQP